MLAAWSLAAVWPASGQERPLRVVIEQALDQPTALSIDNRPLTDGLRAISEKTGVPVNVSDSVLALLPYGAETRVSATFKDVPLREGLKRLFRPIGMRFEVRQRHVEVVASSALLRIGGPASWQELATLERLAGQPWSQKLAAALPLQFRVQADDQARSKLLAQADGIGAGAADDVLEAACDALGWTWYPQDTQIVILRRMDQAARALEKRILLRASHRLLSDVLMELGKEAGMMIRMQPGVIAALPSQTQDEFSLLADNITIRQALELISGVTGLAYVVEPGAIVISLPQATTAPGYRRDPYVGKITVPGKTGRYQFDFLIRESDLPAELNELRKEKVREAIEAMQRELGP